MEFECTEMCFMAADSSGNTNVILKLNIKMCILIINDHMYL